MSTPLGKLNTALVSTCEPKIWQGKLTLDWKKNILKKNQKNYKKYRFFNFFIILILLLSQNSTSTSHINQLNTNANYNGKWNIILSYYINYIMILYNQSFDFVLVSSYDMTCSNFHITHLQWCAIVLVKWSTMLLYLFQYILTITFNFLTTFFSNFDHL